MQYSDPKKEYMSRKYTLTLIALIAMSYKMIATADAMWAVALTGGIAAVIAQYSYFNTQEAKIQKNGGSISAKPPIEGDGA